MGALGWMAVAVVLALSVGALAWLLVRSRRPAPLWDDAERAHAPAHLPDAEAAEDADGPAPHAATEAPSEIPDGRALLRGVYALAFEQAGPAPVAALVQAQAPAHEGIAAACANLLARTEFQARHMPRRPQLLPKLMRAINDPDASLEKVARIIGEDPVLSANLLRVANSPFYRVREKPVESLARAAAMLGLDGLRPVVAAALVQPVMQTGDSPFGRLPALLWDHTQLAADFASSLVRGGRGEEDGFAAQMLGLLHGLGGIIVAQVLRDNYALHPQLRPDPHVVARVLDEQAAPMARRIAIDWELSERIGVALEAQRLGRLPADPLGRALYSGRVAAALAMLRRHGKLGDAQARAMLERWSEAQGAEPGLAALWDRLPS